jgi:hypothetical protein
MWGEDSLKNGRMAGSFTMTMRPVTRRWQFSSSWLRKKITLMSQPPYSPDLAPCDLWLFPKLKTGLQSRCFATVDDIKENTEAGLHAIRKDDFKEFFKAWEDRWSKCVCAEGRYFEGD